MIIRKNTTNIEQDRHFEYPYYCARNQKGLIEAKKRKLLEKYPSGEVICKNETPNAVMAFIRCIENGDAERNGNHFKLCKKEFTTIKHMQKIKW